MPESIPPSATSADRTVAHATPPLANPGGTTDTRSAGGSAVLRSVGTERYTLGEEIASGGMGRVYRATDTVLGREVAVKVLQQEFAPDSGVARRFADEARIAAQLQHPGIPPIHDLGTLADGRPFLAMKLIKGQNLNQLLADPADVAAERGRLVAVFEQVCQALAYAHSHGVVHRDLKPANVMVGAFGEVQVMDWGLAKVLGGRPDAGEDAPAEVASTLVLSPRDGDALLTREGSVLGTPAFMAPEQAIGAVDQIDARSDVFGLGGVLASVLTGHPPFEGDTAEGTRQLAARGKVQDCYARLEASGADPELVALCKRCLSPEKADRPADAAEVAAAVAALRAAADERARRAELDKVRVEGEKAAAQTHSLERRKRRRLALFASALMVMAALASLSTVLRVQQQANADLEAKNLELAERQAEVDRANDDLTARNRELAEQRTEAERRFELAQRAIATFHTGVSEDALLKNREFTELRKRLLTGAAGFYGDLEKLLAEKADPKSQRLLATGYQQLGQLTDRIGDKKEALAAHRKALALWRGLAAAPGADAEARLNVVRSLLEIGRVLNAMGDLDGTMAAAREQIALGDALVAEAPTDTARDALAGGHYVSGIVLFRTGKFPEALAEWGKSRDLWRKLVEEHPDVASYQVSLGDSLNGLGIIASETGRPAEALASYEKAVGVYQKLADAYPDVTRYLMAIGRTENNIATLLRDTGRPAEALLANEKALRARQKLADTHPAVSEFQKDVALTHNDMAVALQMTGKRDDCVAALERARAIQQKLADAAPEVPDVQNDLALTLVNLGEVLAKTTRRNEALPAAKRGVAIFQRLADAYPKVLRYRQHLAGGLTILAERQGEARQYDDALATLDRAQALFEGLRQETPGATVFLIGLGSCRTLRGSVLKEAGRVAEAAAELRRAVAQWDEAGELPADGRLARSKALSLLAGLAKDAKSAVSAAEGARSADAAVAGLRDAFRAGWTQPEELEEHDFDTLRQRDDFRQLRQDVEVKAAAGRQSPEKRSQPPTK
jgi:serine/threonine protein kinase